MTSKNCIELMDWMKYMQVGEDAGSLQQRRGRCACAASPCVCAVARRVLPAARTGAGRAALAQPRRAYACSHCESSSECACNTSINYFFERSGNSYQIYVE
ncbi:hypothetical protein HF086_013086 [Spodoptera exigua]|uniref:Uncharacterized protein n=1 Tax=Spodoptera exigua TaxID=7107 RepID=A0A922M9J7_SPOEX|nr:hypothetical protein HF086_013086 [Spodoptera exigua]